jgi:hypothetical protein
VVQPTVILVQPPGASEAGGVAAPSRTGHGLWIALGGAGLLALAAAVVMVAGGGGKPVAEVRVPVRSQPIGAAVLLDEKDTGVVTNGELVLKAPVPPELTLVFRKKGHKDERRTVRLPLPAGESVSVTLMAESATLPVASDPPGATVTLDGQRVKGVTPLELTLDEGQPHLLAIALEGHVTQETRLVPGQTPAEVRVKMEPSGPLGTVVVASSYAVDVLWRGRVLAKDQTSPRVSLPGGRQTLTLVATSLFLRHDVQVAVTGGAEVSVEAPGVGKLSIRSMPDNAQVFIDGTFVDYPPIHDKPVAAGPHAVSFKWPDGARSQETVEIARGGSAFVTGRKE